MKSMIFERAKPLRYGTRRLEAGDAFEMADRDARIYAALGYARYADSPDGKSARRQRKTKTAQTVTAQGATETEQTVTEQQSPSSSDQPQSMTNSDPAANQQQPAPQPAESEQSVRRGRPVGAVNLPRR